MPELLGRHPRVRLALVGEGPRRPELERMIHQLGIGHRVKLLGWRWDAWNLIEATDLIAHSSIHEPFGIVYVESMAMEKAVVTTDESGAPEILDHGVTGLIVSPRSSEALAAAISELVADPARCRAHGCRRATTCDRQVCVPDNDQTLRGAVGRLVRGAGEATNGVTDSDEWLAAAR